MQEYQSMPHMNETQQRLANDVRADFAAGKINFFFHQMLALLSPQQIADVRVIHKTLNDDVIKVLDYFHQSTCRILNTTQVEAVTQAAIDFINNVQNEKLRVRGFEVPGQEIDEHLKAEVRNERQILEEHARHFLDRVENIITVQ